MYINLVVDLTFFCDYCFCKFIYERKLFCYRRRFIFYEYISRNK